jgi:hypothetical protein
MLKVHYRLLATTFSYSEVSFSNSPHETQENHKSGSRQRISKPKRVLAQNETVRKVLMFPAARYRRAIGEYFTLFISLLLSVEQNKLTAGVKTTRIKQPM